MMNDGAPQQSKLGSNIPIYFPSIGSVLNDDILIMLMHHIYFGSDIRIIDVLILIM